MTKKKAIEAAIHELAIATRGFMAHDVDESEPEGQFEMEQLRKLFRPILTRYANALAKKARAK